MMLALLLLLSVQIGGVLGIYGGCMSYSTTVESSGILKVSSYTLKVCVYHLLPQFWDILKMNIYIFYYHEVLNDFKGEKIDSITIESLDLLKGHVYDL